MTVGSLIEEQLWFRVASLYSFSCFTRYTESYCLSLQGVPWVIRALCKFSLEMVIFRKTWSNGEIILQRVMMIKGNNAILILLKEFVFAVQRNHNSIWNPHLAKSWKRHFFFLDRTTIAIDNLIMNRLLKKWFVLELTSWFICAWLLT